MAVTDLEFKGNIPDCWSQAADNMKRLTSGYACETLSYAVVKDNYGYEYFAVSFGTVGTPMNTDRYGETNALFNSDGKISYLEVGPFAIHLSFSNPNDFYVSVDIDEISRITGMSKECNHTMMSKFLSALQPVLVSTQGQRGRFEIEHTTQLLNDRVYFSSIVDYLNLSCTEAYLRYMQNRYFLSHESKNGEVKQNMCFQEAIDYFYKFAGLTGVMDPDLLRALLYEGDGSINTFLNMIENQLKRYFITPIQYEEDSIAGV